MIDQQPLPFMSDRAPMVLEPGHYWLQGIEDGQFTIGRWTGQGWHIIAIPQAVQMASVLSHFLLGPRIEPPHPASVVLASLA